MRPAKSKPEFIRVLGPPDTRIVGAFYRGIGEGRIVSVDRRNRAEYRVVEARCQRR